MLSTAMQKALRFMAQGGGEGIIDQRGWVVCAGERGPFDAATWLRLVTEGMVEPAGRMRLRLSAAGKAELDKGAGDEPSGLSRCQKWLRENGESYPRTCQECGLRGPCRYGAWEWSKQAGIGGRT